MRNLGVIKKFLSLQNVESKHKYIWNSKMWKASTKTFYIQKCGKQGHNKS